FGQELQNFLFAVRQQIKRVLKTFGFEFLQVFLEQDFGNRLAEKWFIPSDRVDRIVEIFFDRVLEQISFDAGVHGAQEIILIRVHRQKYGFRIGELTADFRGGIDNVQQRHCNIADGDLVTEFLTK